MTPTPKEAGRASYRTRIRRRETIAAEWLSLNPLPDADRVDIAADIGAVLRPEPCVICDQPSDPALPTADWPLCPECFEEISGPWPEEEVEPLWP